jgi:RNA polymerase subunit RPABC4/transcription elongation factor Spt4
MARALGEDPEDLAYIPARPRNLRSCLGCGLLQTHDWWKTNPCPNCEFDGSKSDHYTSASFSGMICLFQPSRSWCAKWQRYHRFRPGLYALDNEGEVSQKLIRHLEEKEKPLPEWVERAKVAFEEAE